MNNLPHFVLQGVQRIPIMQREQIIGVGYLHIALANKHGWFLR